MPHYPPSYYKYRQNHKTITLHFTKEKYNELEKKYGDIKKFIKDILDSSLKNYPNVAQEKEINNLKEQIRKLKELNANLLEKLDLVNKNENES